MGSDMIYRELGRTGEQVSAIGVGGFHLAHPKVSQELSERIVRSAIDRGITFMDNLLARTAPSAAGGRFELFKTSSIYDATAMNPDWLGEEPARVKNVKL